MDENNQPSETATTDAPKRKYRLSPEALAARRASLKKARAAPRDLVYRTTEKRQAASRANLQKAIAARNSPEGSANIRMNAVNKTTSDWKPAAGLVAARSLGTSGVGLSGRLLSWQPGFSSRSWGKISLVTPISTL